MGFGQPKKLAAGELKDYALRLLAGRSLSVADLKGKLRQRAAHLPDIDDIVLQLKEYGALSDSRYAEHYAGARAGGGSFGRQRVLSDLLRRKVAPKIAERAVGDAFAGFDENQMIHQWLARKYRNQDLSALLKDPAKLASAYRRLRQAGFASGPSIRVLKRFAAQAGQLEGLEDGEPAG
ncbi:MAG: RecX family transcriptional regulator [Candidatus Solibacter usitatus]|nr:RecX family transcriptional regulator [Candidatus Solibacter usitatus]